MCFNVFYMIRVGLKLTEGSGPEIARLLRRHPDVELEWIEAEGLSVLEALEGEGIAELVKETGDLEGIDLYIGPEREGIAAAEELKAIYAGGEIVGVCEYSRKAMVRGGRSVRPADAATLLGALALMPLAKHLMLNREVAATLLLPGKGGERRVERMADEELKELRDSILSELQTSFRGEIEATAVRGGGGETWACGVFDVDVKLSEAEARKIYEDFYGDHRHTVLTDKAITNKMTEGTNKAAIGLRSRPGGLTVTVGFDPRYKAGAGNTVHAMNLLFGLDERIGL